MIHTNLHGTYCFTIVSLFLLLLFPPTVYSQCYELVWSEEFNYTGFPDPGTWTYEVGGGGWGNEELQYYKDKDTNNAWVEDGTLVISARKENYGSRERT